MFKRENIQKILDNVAQIDSKYELFGSKKHKYRLNVPFDAAIIRMYEAQYGFTLPDDYFHFITEVGNGGAGPYYGIYPFTFFEKEREEYREKRRRHLSHLFAPLPMTAEQAADYHILEKAYKREPSKFFVINIDDDEDDIEGFFVIGTRGCQYDFGMAITGERRGQIFETDNEGSFIFVANSFDEFYQAWLDSINEEALSKKLEHKV